MYAPLAWRPWLQARSRLRPAQAVQPPGRPRTTHGGVQVGQLAGQLDAGAALRVRGKRAVSARKSPEQKTQPSRAVVVHAKQGGQEVVSADARDASRHATTGDGREGGLTSPEAPCCALSQ
jgi:hypothetical protein